MARQPSAQELLEEDGRYHVLSERVTSKTRWGTRHQLCVQETDGTIWIADFNIESDGETHGLRDDEAAIYEGEAYEFVETRYRRKNAKPPAVGPV